MKVKAATAQDEDKHKAASFFGFVYQFGFGFTKFYCEKINYGHILQI
jgi:hypothetical protein